MPEVSDARNIPFIGQGCGWRPRFATHSLIIVALVILSPAACTLKRAEHSPLKAASDANSFLKALYVDGNYQQAFQLADAQAQRQHNAEALRQLAEGIKQQRGELRTLRADSYLMTQGRAIQLFYIGTYEKGVLYHRVILIGDASSGYKVSEIWYKPDPYPDDPLRRKFDREILVQ